MLGSPNISSPLKISNSLLLLHEVLTEGCTLRAVADQVTPADLGYVALKLIEAGNSKAGEVKGGTVPTKRGKTANLIWQMTDPNAWWVKLFFLSKNSGPGSRFQAFWVNQRSTGKHI